MAFKHIGYMVKERLTGKLRSTRVYKTKKAAIGYLMPYCRDFTLTFDQQAEWSRKRFHELYTIHDIYEETP